MRLDATPSGERLHIAVTGRCNSGKSSLVNALTGQAASLVSEIPGTTADPVRKAMEIPGVGPSVFIDTAGFDDLDENLGPMRINATLKAIEDADIAILVYTCFGHGEEQWYNMLKDRGLPVILVKNVWDTDATAEILSECRQPENETPVTVNAKTGEGKDSVLQAIARQIPADRCARTILGNLVKDGDCVMLVMPQDSQAPKGRLILPQVQTIRELLDRRCTVICCTDGRIRESLARLSSPPALIITDSQAFHEAWSEKPAESRLTSFSILFAAYKGDMSVFLKGAETLGRLPADAKILIAEACTHAPASEDIGRVKIPEMLRRRIGKGISIDITSGNDFPDDLSGYDLIIHCGACMFNRAYVMNRIRKAMEQGVPVTNYGMALAWAQGILDKVALP